MAVALRHGFRPTEGTLTDGQNGQLSQTGGIALMSRRLFNFAAACALALSLAPAAFSQETQPVQPPPPQPAQPVQQPQQTRTTVTTQTTQAVQNSDGTWTVIQYPANKEVVVDFTPAPTRSEEHTSELQSP